MRHHGAFWAQSVSRMRLLSIASARSGRHATALSFRCGPSLRGGGDVNAAFTLRRQDHEMPQAMVGIRARRKGPWPDRGAGVCHEGAHGERACLDRCGRRPPVRVSHSGSTRPATGEGWRDERGADGVMPGSTLVGGIREAHSAVIRLRVFPGERHVNPAFTLRRQNFGMPSAMVGIRAARRR